MNRILSIAMVMLFAASAFAVDRFNQDPELKSIVTTARILRIDLKTRTLKVRGAEPQAPRLTPEIIRESLWQRIGGRVPSVRMPGIMVILQRNPSRNAFDFSVLTNDDTVFQDGIDPLRLEDFRAGETISIHGILSGSTVRASRIAKWD